MRRSFGIVAAVMLMSSTRDAHACWPWDPSLDRTFPAAGGVIPEGAVLLLDGQVLRPESLAVTVDGQAGELVLVPERSHGFYYSAWDFAYRTMALRIEPPPQPGQAIVVTGDPCLQWKGMTYCDEVELVYTVGQADIEPPDAPAELFYDVYDHGMEVTDHQLCVANPPVRYEVTIDTEIEHYVLEYPLEYRLSRRLRDAPGAWGLVEHDWLRDAQAPDPSLRWLFSLANVETLLPLAEAWCLRFETFDASENLGGEVEVCPPCHDQTEDEASFLAYWPSSSPSYDGEWLYPDGHCPATLEPEDDPDTTGTDGAPPTLTDGEPMPEDSTSSGGGEPSSSDLPDRGCACMAAPTRCTWAFAGIVGLVLLGAGRPRPRGGRRARTRPQRDPSSMKRAKRLISSSRLPGPPRARNVSSLTSMKTQSSSDR